MIPATQRPDGTWRKARKIRTGFNSRSGGATRYVPPAFRNAVGGDVGGEDKGIDPGADGQTRRLGEIIATDGRRSARRFVNAALFLLTTARVSSCGRTAGPRKERDRGQGGGSAGGGTGESDGHLVEALGLPVRSAVTAAKAELGCDDCRRIPAETGCDDASAAASASEQEAESRNTFTCGSTEIGEGCRSKTRSKTRSGCPNQENKQRGSDSHTDGWWAKLRQADRGWLATNPKQRQEATTTPEKREQGEAWVGLELRLKASDVCCTEGQAAIVNFLKGRLGPHVVTPEGKDGKEEDARSPKETCTPEGTTRELEPVSTGVSSSAETRPAATSGDDGQEREETTRSESGRTTETAECFRRSEGEATADAGMAQGQRRRRRPEDDRPSQTGDPVTVVVVAVLVFGRELSKRDRAELHGEAERTGGVASASHGMGEERFLTLACGLEGRAGAVELELSAEKAELARRLFRLAQQEYHSRYECLSHREIREVVALGGPDPEDHPDLFRLVEKQQNSSSGGGSSGTSSSNAVRNKARDSKAAAAVPSPAVEPSAEQRGATAKATQKKKQQKNDNHPRDDAVGAEGGRGMSPSKRGEKEEGDQISLPREVEETNERVQALEKCPW